MGVWATVWVNRDNNDFAHRIGIAWSPTANWVVRTFRRHAAEGPAVFIDSDGYRAYVAEREKAFRQEWDRQKK